jgi:hypothetical protein
MMKIMKPRKSILALAIAVMATLLSLGGAAAFAADGTLAAIAITEAKSGLPVGETGVAIAKGDANDPLTYDEIQARIQGLRDGMGLPRNNVTEAERARQVEECNAARTERDAVRENGAAVIERGPSWPLNAGRNDIAAREPLAGRPISTAPAEGVEAPERPEIPTAGINRERLEERIRFYQEMGLEVPQEIFDLLDTLD